MRFYNRASELAELDRIRELSMGGPSRMTVITGRRRIGKTSLIMKLAETRNVREATDTEDAVDGTASVAIYLFVARKSETSLCRDYIQIVSQSLKTFVPDEIQTFRSLFQCLLEIAHNRPFTLIIDEFQEFYNINSSIYSDMQNLWDQYKNKTRMNLIVSGSVYSLMQKLFQNAKEPLFGRADAIIKLSAFDTSMLKTILGDYAPAFAKDDLLALYAFTGGVPKYVELLCDNNALTISSMIEFMVRDNSPFVEEGKNLLIEEFGKNYGLYFSILSAVSGGINTQAAIENAVGNASIGGHLKRLIEDYGILVRQRPILAKAGTQSVRYEIADNFIKFWFHFFDRNRSLIEIKNFPALQNIIKAGYETYSGRALEAYFKQQFAETRLYRDIGSWWESKGDQGEIDIVALKLEKNQAVAVEVKRQKKKYSPRLLEAKAERLRQRLLPDYAIEARCLSLEDM
jgi:AAA+ ATPase superfamily predicted ATPase